MIIVYEKEGYEHCDSISKLIQLVEKQNEPTWYPGEEIRCVYANVPSSYFSNMFVRFRATPELKEYVHRERQSAPSYFLLASESEKDQPPDLVTVVGRVIDQDGPGKVSSLDIGDLLYLESLPEQLAAIRDFAQFELQTLAIPELYDINFDPIEHGCIRKTPMKNFYTPTYFEPFNVSKKHPYGEFVFVDVGYSEPIAGFGYLVDSQFFAEVEYDMKMDWILEISGLPGEEESEVHTIKGWETDLSFWNACYLSSMYCTIMAKLYPNADIELRFYDKQSGTMSTGAKLPIVKRKMKSDEELAKLCEADELTEEVQGPDARKEYDLMKWVISYRKWLGNRFA